MPRYAKLACGETAVLSGATLSPNGLRVKLNRPNVQWPIIILVWHTQLRGNAIEEYRAAIRLKPDSAGAHNNLGIAYASQGKLDKAIAEFQITSQLKPDDAEPHMNLGIAYISLGQLDRAVTEFQTAIQLRPNNAGAHYNLGNTYATQGLWDRAIVEYQSALRLNPDFHQARQQLNDIVSRRH
jgi:Flp pilus assembly protein TadD